MSHLPSVLQRQRIIVQGIVQGVGFRPFVYGLATELNLTGFVRNDSNGVTIEIEGPATTVERFLDSLSNRTPPLARIDSIIADPIAPSNQQASDAVFAIVHSTAGASRQTLISPDVATCDDCLQEVLDAADRRYHYPFTNCTNCGPRFTIVQDIPYDRDKTTMRDFVMCPACRAEYEDPLNRRFHAQPNACPVCGPAVRLEIGDWETGSRGAGGQRGRGELAIDNYQLSIVNYEAVEAAARCLAEGAILAVKGLGGYHLACDALNGAAVARLRRRKQREAKPFALMVPDLATAEQLCYVSPAEAELLGSRRRPIVLLQQRPDSPIAADVAPGYATLGLMLPYTPLHVLLLDAFRQQVLAERPVVLVMTSGNVSDEPIAYRDEEAQKRLVAIADGWLFHNRDIHIRCDDSIVRVAAGGQQIFRRSRGYVPEPLKMARPFPVPVLACGAHLKNTFCLGKQQQAFLGHHIGDLENLETLLSFREGIEHFQNLFDVRPQAVAYDLHPDYLATKYALDLDIPNKIAVQHHHAHIASVLAEYGLDGPVIGVAADGTGYGLDGTIWGGEILIADCRTFKRSGYLRQFALPGGEQAVRQPWRVAAACLQQCYGDEFWALELPFTKAMDRQKWRPLAQMIQRGVNSPRTSSLGRLFDAVAALIGIRQEVVYEGQAAIELEALAAPQESGYPFALEQGMPMQLDWRPTIRAIVHDIQAGIPTAIIAGRFQRTVAEMLAAACQRAREETDLRTVALSGGVFQNRLLLEQLDYLLKADGFQVYTNRQVPPNDGGLSLGQAAVAAARLEEEVEIRDWRLLEISGQLAVDSRQ